MDVREEQCLTVKRDTMRHADVAHVAARAGRLEYLPQLIDLVFNGTINPGKVFDLVQPLAEVAEGYRAMDERRAITTLLRP